MKAFKKNKQAQNKVAGIIVVFGIGFLILLYTLFFGEEEGAQEENKVKGNYSKKFETGRRQVNDNEIFADEIEKEQKALKGELGEVNKHLSELKDMFQESLKDSSQKDVEIDDLKRNLDQIMNQPPAFQGNSMIDSYQKDPSAALNGREMNPSMEPFGEIKSTGGLKKITLKLQAKPKKQEKYKRTTDNYISANEYGIGRLVSTVYASTATESANNPEPIKFKITNRGIMPKAFGRDLNQCYVSGAAYGDGSSERVKVRLERMSCIERRSGEKIDVPIAGYVSGEDGANGMRGKIISRTGKIMRNSAMLGFLNGMTKFFSSLSQSSVYPKSPFGQTDALKPEDMMAAGGAEGVGTGLDLIMKKYAKFLDRLDPVVYIANGRKATIHFTKGVDLNQTEFRKNKSEKNNKVRDRLIETGLNETSFSEKSKVTKEDVVPWMKEGDSV